MVHEKFVDDVIAELGQCGSAKDVSMAEVCVVSPLGVVEGMKLRLIFGLRYVNSHLAIFRFKVMVLTVWLICMRRGIVQFDLKSAHHHIDIWPPAKYLGFKWKGRVYVFCSLLFGLSAAPYCFTM